MRKLIFASLMLSFALSASAQDQIETFYYDKDGYGVAQKEFADYYRIVSTINGQNRYKTFHMNGQVMASGEFISLDKNDDRNSKFVGTVAIYDESGVISSVRNYKDGLLDGILEEYLPDGTMIQEEYVAGKPARDHFIKSDREGNIVKVRYSDNSLMWDSPAVSEMLVDYHEGNKWSHYSKNGVTVALNTTTIRDYGKYHVLNITIDNNSLVPIEFEPSMNITAESVNSKKGVTTPLKVFSCEDFLAKYDRRTAWGAAFLGLSEALTLVDAGVSESKSVTVNSKGEKSVTYTRTYDPFDHFLEWHIANMEMREYEDDVINGREVRRVGYIKRTTIYPGESISGYAYVQRVKGNQITINIDIEGAIYTYTWNYKK